MANDKQTYSAFLVINDFDESLHFFLSLHASVVGQALCRVDCGYILLWHISGPLLELAALISEILLSLLLEMRLMLLLLATMCRYILLVTAVSFIHMSSMSP
jgi:hypothetical protein